MIFTARYVSYLLSLAIEQQEALEARIRELELALVQSELRQLMAK